MEEKTSAGAAEVAAEAAPRTYTRKASGFVRDVGIRETFGLAAAIVAPMYVFISLASGLSLFPNTDYTISMIVITVLWVLLILAYRQLVVAVPRAGGEYTYTSRLLTPAIGAMIGVGFAIFCAQQVAVGARLLADPGLPILLNAVGLGVHSGSISHAATTVGSPTGLVLSGVGVILICAVLAFLSLRSIGRILFYAVLAQLVAMVLAVGLLVLNSHHDFVRAFNNYSGSSHAYGALLSAARGSGGLPATTFAGIVGAIPFLYLVLNGVQWGNYAGGELKRPKRTFLWASFAVLAIATILDLLVWLGMKHSAGLDFMRAQQLVAAQNPTAYGHITSLSAGGGGIGYALLLAGDPVSRIILGVTFASAQVLIAVMWFVVGARMLYALSVDRLLPDVVAKVDQRRHSPVVASLIIVALAMVFNVLLRYTSLANALTNSSLIQAFVTIAALIGATIMPYRRPLLLDDTRKFAGIPRVTLIAGSAALLLSVIFVVIAIHPADYGEFTTASEINLVVLALAGPVIYGLVRFWKRKQSIDVSLAMRELPPE